MDNYATHKQPTVRAWLAANPRIHVHFTPSIMVFPGAFVGPGVRLRRGG
jgi:hypothetical protein